MREQIQAYVNGLFADAALTIRNAEVRQEILQHTLDRYDDLVASGKPEQEAYDEAVAGIGDVSELYEHKPAEKQAEAPKSARDFPAPDMPVTSKNSIVLFPPSRFIPAFELHIPARRRIRAEPFPEPGQ